jgi:V8-like Glu-specific endopeptidase
MSTAPDRRGHLRTDIQAWGGASGAGIYNRENKLVGIISSSQYGAEPLDDTRTTFVPAIEIETAFVCFYK